MVFVGTGNWAHRLAEAAISSGVMKIVSCFDSDFLKSLSFAKRFGCYTEKKFSDLTRDKNVEAVFITTPNYMHCKYAVLSAKEGKHIFIEKPISNTIEDALKIINECERKGVVLMVGHNTRRLSGHRKVKDLVESSIYGKVVSAECNISHAGGLYLKKSDWRWYKRKCPSGPFLQLGIHHVDTLNFILGKPRSIFAVFKKIVTNSEIEDITSAIMEYDSGVLAYVGSNYVIPDVFYLNLYCTKANIFCNYGTNISIKGHSGKILKTMNFERNDTLVEEIKEFADCIKSGKKPETDGKVALDALSVVLSAIESNRKNKPVK